eukprot:gene35090-45481_t
MPKVVIVPDEEGVCDYAAELVRRRIAAHRGERPFVLGLPTPGALAAGILQRIVRHVARGGLSFENVVTFCADEVCGVHRGHPGTTHAFLWAHLFRRIDIHPKNVHMLDGEAEDVHAECMEYEALLDRYPQPPQPQQPQLPPPPHQVTRQGSRGSDCSSEDKDKKAKSGLELLPMRMEGHTKGEYLHTYAPPTRRRASDDDDDEDPRGDR